MNTHVDYYGDFSIDKSAGTKFVKSSERINLLLGKPQKIKNFETVDELHRTDWFNSPVSSKELTDGKYAEIADCQDPAWFRFTVGAARSILFDLGGVCAVDGVRVGALRDTASGVYLPNRVCVLLSENGEDWQTVCELIGSSEKPNEIVRVSGDFGKKYKARYAKISFSVVTHVFIDEIELFGCCNDENAESIVPDSVLDADFPDRFASTEQLGAKDVLLAYFCHPNVKPITKEIFLPHVAYIEDGVIKDTLFDSYLFLPYVSFLYEGYKKRPLKKADWQHYIDTQYQDGVNMDALEAAAEEVGKALGDPDYKVSAFLSILYPVTEVSEFGEINGKNLNFAEVEDRKTALKWLIDEQLERFYAKNYKHITLNGFYWFTEEISYSDEQLMELLRYTTDYVRGKNLITTWIPYFHATGFNDWRHLGFDIACYQPNYAFNQNVPDIRLFDAAATAKLLGMCIELEVGGTEPWHIERIKKYYAAGAITGYMKDAAHMYYQGGVPGVYYDAYVSEDPNLHSVYNDTYRFIKGTFGADEIKFNEEELPK